MLAAFIAESTTREVMSRAASGQAASVADASNIETDTNEGVFIISAPLSVDMI
jgi:hypothetical protein